MSIVILSDIHSNLESFEAVLKDSAHELVDQVLFLGDIVGYGADPDRCIEILRGLTTTTVAGNHDWAAVGLTDTGYFNPVARAAVEWTADVITSDHAFFLRALPLRMSLPGMLLVHATPHQPEVWDYIFSVDDASTCFKHFDQQLCFTGHSHTPVTFMQDSEGNISVVADSTFTLRESYRYLVNVGSVGQPRDGDPRAAYGIYKPEEASFTLRRVPYDIRRAQEKIRAAGLPPFLAARLAEGR
jgi:diadenosine tetraphosphatase ApaH/serine/threonine PP2A family protein phosphatase